MGIITPTEADDSGVWDTILNTAFGVVDSHDHTTGQGVLVPTAGLNIDADLTFAGNDATNVGVVGFTDIASTTVVTSLHVKTSDNELYWRTAGGVDVQITNGASLDFTLVGGITGDYSTTNADLEYVDAEKAYELKQDESPDHWANMKVGNVRIAEPTSGIIEFVTLKSPTGLASSYDWVFPAALPASVELLTIDAAGDVDHTLTPPTLTAVTASGDITSSAGNLVATAGNVTATSGYVQTSEPNIRHASDIRTIPIPWIDGQWGGTYGDDAAGGIAPLSGVDGVLGGAGSGGAYYDPGGYSSPRLAFEIPVAVGERLTRVQAIVFDNDGGQSISLGVWEEVHSGSPPPTLNQLGSTQTSSDSTFFQFLVVGSIDTERLDETTLYRAHISLTGASANIRLYGLTCTVDRLT